MYPNRKTNPEVRPQLERRRFSADYKRRTVNESSQQRQKMLDLFSTVRDTDWRNRLIWDDKKYVLPSLLPEFRGQVGLDIHATSGGSGGEEVTTISFKQSPLSASRGDLGVRF